MDTVLGWEDSGFINQVGFGSQSVSGAFTLTEKFNNGDSGYIFGSTYAYTAASVPEPGVLSLLGIGLLGLLGVSRRRVA